MSKILTAQEFIIEFQDKFRENGQGVVRQLMIEFAKLHRKAILEATSHTLDVNNDRDYLKYPTKESILNSYPEKLIQ